MTKTLLGCTMALLLAGSAVQADELDREAKSKPKTAPVVNATEKPAIGSELDKESPEQSHHHHWRGGFGYSSYYGGYGYGYRPYYSSFSYGSYYTPYYGSYYRPYYGYGYSSFYRPYYSGISFSYRW